MKCDRILKGLSLILIAFSIALREPVNAQTQRPNYRTVLPILQQKTRIPILLPSLLPSDLPVYGNPASIDAEGYIVLLDYTADCGGAAVCTYGRVSGNIRPKNAKQPSGKVVLLVNGIKGYFILNDTEENCNTGYCFASLTWDLTGVRYRVKLKSAKESDLIQAANSAIKSARH